jgi:hypothetical protein
LNGVEWSRFESFKARNLKKLSKPVLGLFEIIAEEITRLIGNGWIADICPTRVTAAAPPPISTPSVPDDMT